MEVYATDMWSANELAHPGSHVVWPSRLPWRAKSLSPNRMRCSPWGKSSLLCLGEKPFAERSVLRVVGTVCQRKKKKISWIWQRRANSCYLWPLCPLWLATNQIFIKKLAYILCDFSEQNTIMPDVLQQGLVYWDQIKLNILEKTWTFPNC